MHRNVIVVGGGASGLVAAIAAAREGSHVTLLEHNDRVGKKDFGDRKREVQYDKQKYGVGILPQ